MKRIITKHLRTELTVCGFIVLTQITYNLLIFEAKSFTVCPVKARIFHSNESFLLVAISSLQCSSFLKERGSKIGSSHFNQIFSFSQDNTVSDIMMSKVIKRQTSAKSLVRTDRQNSRGIATEKMQKFPVIGQTF